MTDLNVLARNVEQLSSTVSNKFAAIDKVLATHEQNLGSIVIPAASRRGGIAGRVALPEAGKEVERAAIAKFLRSKGDEATLAGLGSLEEGTEFSAQGGMSVGSDPQGGYTVVPELSSTIQKRVYDLSPIARLARHETITKGDAFEEPLDVGDIDARWVGETEERPELDTSKLKMMHVPLHEIYTLQPITQRLLDDSRYDLGAWIEEKISDKFARSEGAAYIHGDGIGKPMGLLYRPTSAEKDGVRDFFTLQHINTGVGGGFILADAGSGVGPADVLIDTVYSLRAPYRQNARWLMNLATAGVVRKLKDSEGRYVWREATAEGQPATLLGFPVELDEEMPDIDAGSLSIAFGDFRQAYITIDKPGIRMLVDPFTKKPWVLFYAYRRAGGQIQNGEAVKVVRFAAAD